MTQHFLRGIIARFLFILIVVTINETAYSFSINKGKKLTVCQLGQIVEEYPNSREALQFAGLDFNVVKMPNIHRLQDGTETVSKTSFLPTVPITAQY